MLLQNGTSRNAHILCGGLKSALDHVCRQPLEKGPQGLVILFLGCSGDGCGTGHSVCTIICSGRVRGHGMVLGSILDTAVKNVINRWLKVIVCAAIKNFTMYVPSSTSPTSL